MVHLELGGLIFVRHGPTRHKTQNGPFRAVQPDYHRMDSTGMVHGTQQKVLIYIILQHALYDTFTLVTLQFFYIYISSHAEPAPGRPARITTPDRMVQHYN